MNFHLGGGGAIGYMPTKLGGGGGGYNGKDPGKDPRNNPPPTKP